MQVFDRGNKYHLMHSLLLAAAPLAHRPHAVGACATAGILLFSGSCYAAAFTEDRANAKLAPYGGMSPDCSVALPSYIESNHEVHLRIEPSL